MRYLVIVISILLLAAVIWLVFSSGIFFKKADTAINNLEVDNPSPSSRNMTAILETSHGLIKILLDQEAAPKTSANFEKLIREGFYDGLTMHRIIPGFVIQGGDPKGDGTGGPGYTVPAEIKLLHKRGAVATARLADGANPKRESSGSQFYIALEDLPSLDGQYTVFGQVTEGMDIVDKIAASKTNAFDKPLEPVIINKAFIEE